MKHFSLMKKTVALFVAILLSFSALLAMSVSASDEPELITVSEEVYMTAQELLIGIDMLGSYQSKPDAAITRSDFAQLLADIMRYSDFATPETGYRDVADNTRNASAIGFAIEQGYMVGDKGLFRPLDPVTYAEACRAFVVLTGNNMNKTAAEASDFMMKASGLGVCKGISSKNGNAYLSFGAAYKMAVNTLTARSHKMAAVESGYISEVDSGNFLEVAHQIKRVGGVLTKTRYAGIYSAVGTGKNSVEIDNIRFVAEEDWTKYLGCQVYAYVDYSDDAAVILHMVPSSENVTVELKAEDIISINNSKTEIIYNLTNGEDDDETMKISNTTMVIWNSAYGGSVMNFTASQLSLRSADGAPKAGYVRLIDHDGDDHCDVMIVTSYEIYYPAQVDQRLEWLTDTNRTEADGKVFRLGDYKEGNRFMTYDTGDTLDFASFDKKLVYHIAESRDKKLVSIVVGSKSIETTVTAVREVGGVTEYCADGVWYTGNDYYDKYYKNGAEKLYVGWHGNLNLDVDGRIATVSSKSQSYWGYLINISQGQGLSEDRQVKMFSNYETKQDVYEIQILDMAQKVQVDAGIGAFTTYKASQVRDLPAFKNGSNFRDQLIRYTVNDEGKISSIKTANTDNTWGYNQFANGRSDSLEWYSDHSDFALCYDAEYDGEPLTANNTLNCFLGGYGTSLSFGNLFLLDEEAVPYWVIPADLSDEKAFSRCVYSDYGQIEAPNYKVYDLKPDGSASNIVWKMPSGAEQAYEYSSWQRLFVTEVLKVAANDGGTETVVSGYRHTRYSYDKQPLITLRATESNMFDDVLIGDLITYSIDFSGAVTSVKRIFSYQRKGTAEESEYKWAHVDNPSSAPDTPYGHSYMEDEYEGTHWIYSVRREPAELTTSGASYYGYNAPYWGKVLYHNNKGVTLTFDNPYDDTENYGTCHQAFVKTNYFQWIMHDTKTGETWLETMPTIYSVMDVGVEEAQEVLVMSGNNYGINMGIVYLK